MEYILSEELKNQGRMNIKDFIRERVLTFPTLVLFFINQAKKTLQVSLNQFCKSANLVTLTKQAFSKARKKLSAHAFTLVNRKLIEEFYSDNSYFLWNDFRLLAIDGSDVQLPKNEHLKENYGTAHNQTGSTLIMAKVSYAYDVLNHLTLDVQINRAKTSERDLSMEHVEVLQKLKHDKIKNLYLFDRGYPSLGMFFFLSEKKEDFLFRCSTTSCFSKIKENYDKGEKDFIVRLFANQSNGNHGKEIKKRVPGLDRKSAYIDVRAVVVTLDTGEDELLITSLLEKEIYPHAEFKELYNRRWRVEENIKWHKSAFELENFNGSSKLAIEQELFALVLTANMASLLIQEAQEEVDNDPQIQTRKHPYKINKRIAIAIIKDRLLEGILNRDTDMESLCENLKAEMKRNLCLNRPARKFKRTKKNRQKYSMASRSCI